MSTSLWGQELRGPEWSQFKQDLSRRYSVEPCAAFLINSFLLTSRTDKILIRALKLSALTFIKSNHRVLRAARLSTDAYSFPALWMEVNLECMIYLAGTNRDEATTFILFFKGSALLRGCPVIAFGRGGWMENRHVAGAVALGAFQSTLKEQIRRLTMGMTDGQPLYVLTIVWIPDGIRVAVTSPVIPILPLFTLFLLILTRQNHSSWVNTSSVARRDITCQVDSVGEA